MKVTTQLELDAALANTRVSVITIDSPAGVWITLSGTGDKHVEVTGNSVIKWADGNSVIERADGNSVIERADGNSVIERATGNSVIKWATGNSVIKWADGNSVIEWADGNSVIGALYSKVTKAMQAVAVHAYERAVVEKAAPTVAVFLHSAKATVAGGQIIDLTTLSLDTAQGWCDWNDVEIIDGKAILYKAVNDQYRSGYGYDYPVGTTVTAPDWRDTDACGNGLHFCPTPRQARDYNSSATKFLRVAAPIETLRPITGDSTPKCKVLTADVLVEVDIDGVEIPAEVTA